MLPYVSIIYFTFNNNFQVILVPCLLCCCVPLGLPMRPGARICESFAKNGTCRVGTACRFDHPEGMKAAEPNLKTWWHGQFHQVSANIFLNHVGTAVYHGISWNIMDIVWHVVTCCDVGRSLSTPKGFQWDHGQRFALTTCPGLSWKFPKFHRFSFWRLMPSDIRWQQRSMGTCDFKRNCKWHHPDKRERGK